MSVFTENFTENDYRRFRTMLKFFVDQAARNQKVVDSGGHMVYTTSHKRGSGEYKPGFYDHYHKNHPALKEDWYKFPNDLCYRIAFRGNWWMNTPGTTYININRTWINIRPEFSDEIAGKIIGFHSVYRADRDDDPVAGMPEEESYTIEDLELDADPNDEVTSKLRQMFNHQELMWKCYRRAHEKESVAGGLTKFERKVREALLNDKNIVLHGAPGTGKTYMAFNIAANLIGVSREELNGSDRFGFVQFHPSYDYTDFVEGLRPYTISDAQDGDETGSGRADVGGAVGFRLVPGVFTAFIARAQEDDKSKPYVFVIDEINRGDIARIFGELFFAIDPGYRGIRGSVTTQYANMHDEDEYQKFYIPENVYIVGTMNDIDRSVDTFDFAMRRRFRFIEVGAKNTQEDILRGVGYSDANREEITERMDALNETITGVPGLGPEYVLGASYFTKAQGEDVQTDFERLWSDFLEPLLREYLRGRDDAENVLDTLKDAYNPGRVADSSQDTVSSNI